MGAGQKDTNAFNEFTRNGLITLIRDGFGVPINSISSIASANDIGNLSRGVTTKYNRQGETWQVSMISFRVKGIGAWVFVRNNANLQSPISAEKVARVYANSIQQPEISCKLISVEPDTNADVPTFNFEAEGFYPNEGRFISLNGSLLLGDETKSVTSAKMGGGGESVDPEGQITDTISFFSMEQLAAQGLENAELPSGPTEYTLIVGGFASGCEIEQIVTWPGDLTPTSENEATPTIMPTEGSFEDEESMNVREISRRGSQIQERGIIQIGVRNDDMYPMNFQEESIHKGFEIDLAIEIVSRLFGDELGIEWIPLTAQERIEAVQNEDVDFLIRNFTHTTSRAELVLFSSTYFLEGGSESEPLAIAVSQTDPVFRNNIDRILLEIIEDGTWQKIYDRWFDDPPLWTIEDMLSLPPANR